MSIFSQRSGTSKRPRGFTLIELLVVVAIMVVVTSILLVRQSRFNSSTLLRSLAYSAALSVRQAQVYTTSTFGTTTTLAVCGSGTYQNNACFTQGYGIYVNWGSGNPTSYILFADINNNGTYNAGEDVKVYNLGRGYSISRMCANTGVSQDCTGGTLTWLSILYRRPNPEACFTTNVGTNSTACAVGATAVYATSSIQIQSDSGDAGSTRSIFINSTGLISVGNVGT